MNSFLDKFVAKISIVLLLSVFIKPDACAQTNISLGYYDSEMTSRNIGLIVSKRKKKHTYSYGIKYHIDDKLQPVVYPWGGNLYADNFAQHFGIMLGYEHDLFRNNKVALKAAYSFQGIVNGVRNIYRIYDIQANSFYYDTYKKTPVLFVDNLLSLALNVNLTDKIGFYAQFGGGLSNYVYPDKDSDVKILGVKGSYSWDFIRYAYSAGISYTLANTSKKKKKK